jgi:general secretion pathway protein D
VGVNLTITPRVAASGDITLELAAEFSLLGDDRNVGSEGNPINVPTFFTRNVTGVLRLRDGETGLIGGLLQGREATSFAGAIGMNSIPIIGKLFGDRRRQVDETEVLISITPRIVRAPKVTEDDLVALRVGTQEVPKVEGARPPLFGTEPEPPAVSPGPGAAAGSTTGARPGAAAPSTAAPAGATPPAPASAAPPGSSPAAGADARPVTVLLSPPELALRRGETAGLAVVLVGAKDVQSVEVTLAWDPALAEVTEVAAGSLLTLDGSSVAAERTLEAGRARVRFTRAGGASGSGAVAAITMRGLREGSGTIAVESIALGRGDAVDRPAPPAPGRLAVAP